MHGIYSLCVETNNKQLIFHFKCDKHGEAEQGTMRAFNRFGFVGPQGMTAREWTDEMILKDEQN